MTPRLILQLSLGAVALVTATQAQDADITTKSVVVPGKRGKPDIRMESTYRGKTCIMRVLSNRRGSDEFVPYARSFHVGHAMVVDSDEDRDGFFETLAIMEDLQESRTLEIFRRNRDGTMHAIPAEERKKIEETLDNIKSFLREALSPR